MAKAASPRKSRISRDDGLTDRFPSVGALDVAEAQSAEFEVPKLVEDEQRLIAYTAKMTVPGGALPRAMSWGRTPTSLRQFRRESYAKYVALSRHTCGHSKHLGPLL